LGGLDLEFQPGVWGYF